MDERTIRRRLRRVEKLMAWAGFLAREYGRVADGATRPATRVRALEARLVNLARETCLLREATRLERLRWAALRREAEGLRAWRARVALINAAARPSRS